MASAFSIDLALLRTREPTLLRKVRAGSDGLNQETVESWVEDAEAELLEALATQGITDVTATGFQATTTRKIQSAVVDYVRARVWESAQQYDPAREAMRRYEKLVEQIRKDPQSLGLTQDNLAPQPRSNLDADGRPKASRRRTNKYGAGHKF